MERNEVSNLEPVECRDVLQIGAMEEDLKPVSQTNIAIRLSDEQTGNFPAGRRASWLLGLTDLPEPKTLIHIGGDASRQDIRLTRCP